MRRILLCMTVVAALGACAGGSKKSATKTEKLTTASTAAAGATGAATGSGSGAAGGPATTAPKAATATTAKAGTTAVGSTSSGGGASNSSGGGSGTSGSSGKTGSPSMAAVPAGHYHYTITGTSSVGSPPPGADLAVDAPQGTSQHSRLTSQSQTGSATTDTTVDQQADGAHLVDLTTASSAFTLSFHPSPPPRIQPQPLAVGSSVGPFDMTSTDGSTIATTKITIQALNEAVTLGDNTSVSTTRVEVDTTLRCADGKSCPFSGTINSTRWLRSDGLEVKEHGVTDGTYSGAFGTFPVKSDTTSLIDKGSPS